ncbi:hypothetical protein BX600DRAFT_469523 [Xylariales sp. PMI_506]|nr:hypothetical protein BX600DRAFT_469523 [Xylariales sp. PMI_506]
MKSGAVAARQAHIRDFAAWVRKQETVGKHEEFARLRKQLNGDGRYNGGNESPGSSSTPRSDSGDAYAKRVDGACRDRALFVTSDGKVMGLGPAATRETDKVCILEGGKVPFLLRGPGRWESAKEVETYQLVGPCYLYGAMNGEFEAEVETRSEPFILL